MSREPYTLKGCPSGHNSSRVIGGPGTVGGPKYWAGCDHCNWRTWGYTEAEAVKTWNNRVGGAPNA